MISTGISIRLGSPAKLNRGSGYGPAGLPRPSTSGEFDWRDYQETEYGAVGEIVRASNWVYGLK